MQGVAQLPKCAFGDTRIEQPVIQPFGPCDVPVKKNEGFWATWYLWSGDSYSQMIKDRLGVASLVSTYSEDMEVPDFSRTLNPFKSEFEQGDARPSR